jgi:aminoglycoside/choline kinase family phosphotransferase
VLARDIDAGFLLLEDLGGPTLAQVINADNADAHVRRRDHPVAALQAIAPPADMGEFGEALLQRDAGLFEDWFCAATSAWNWTAATAETLQLAQRRLMDNALAQAQVLTHRDFMPRNLMPVAPEDGPAVLDFQDMRARPDRLRRGQPVQGRLPQLAADARVDAGWRYHARALAAGLPVPDIASASCAMRTGWACSGT